MTQPLKTLTINFKNKYFYNSVDWLGFYFQLCVPSSLAKTLRFIVFRILKNPLVELPLPWHDLIINPPCRTVSR